MNVFSMKTQAAALTFVFALALTPAFADVIHLRNGQEVQNAKVIKIGADDVEYKVGSRDVIYTAKKADIAIIFYDDGSKETFANDQAAAPSQSQVQNNSQVMQNQIIIGGAVEEREPLSIRWKTFWLNMFVPGVGSINYMNDWTGAFVQWGLIGGGLLMVAKYNCPYGACKEEQIASMVGGVVSSIIWNGYRSYTYDYEGAKTASKYGDINMAVFPSRRGNGAAYGVMYNLGF